MVAPESPPPRDDDRRITLKVLIPAHIAGSIIGKGGEAIKELKTKTKAHIKVSGRDEIFPYTDERIVLVVAPAESAMEAVTFIHAKLRSPTNSGSKSQRNMPKRNKEMKLIVADTSAGKIIGKGGGTVKKIQEDHKVKVFLTSKEDWGVVPGERVATISGEELDVNSAIEDILEKILEDPYARLNKSLVYPPYPMFDYHGYHGPPERFFRGPPRRQDSPPKDAAYKPGGRSHDPYDYPPPPKDGAYKPGGRYPPPRYNGYQPEQPPFHGAPPHRRY